jgi:hypothetical protein
LGLTEFNTLQVAVQKTLGEDPPDNTLFKQITGALSGVMSIVATAAGGPAAGAASGLFATIIAGVTTSLDADAEDTTLDNLATTQK